MSILVTGIAELTTNDPERGDDAGSDPGDRLLGIVRDAALVVSGSGPDAVVEWVGRAADAPAADERRDLGGRAVIPGFVDSHTHLVFAGDRSAEFAARMTGTPYDGGGIAVSVAATRAASDDELRRLVAARVAEMRAQGTTTVEIKSGYGLTVDDELRSLRIAREFTSHTTFLGAHVVPREHAADRDGIRRARHRPDARRRRRRRRTRARREHRRLLRAALRARLRRRRGARGPRGRAGCGPRPARARQPARPRPRRAARLRARRAQRRPLHLPRRRRRRGPRRRERHDGRDPPSGSGVLDALALPRRPPSHRCRCRRRARERLQPRHLLLVLDALRHRPRGPRDGHDPGRGAARRDRGVGALARPRPPSSRRAARPSSPSSTARATCTWPTAPACRSCARSTSDGRLHVRSARQPPVGSDASTCSQRSTDPGPGWISPVCPSAHSTT